MMAPEILRRHYASNYQAARKLDILASSFVKLRMRPRVFNDFILMVSLLNHEQHRFSAAC
jgi:hypothetical protein